MDFARDDHGYTQLSLLARGIPAAEWRKETVCTPRGDDILGNFDRDKTQRLAPGKLCSMFLLPGDEISELHRRTTLRLTDTIERMCHGKFPYIHNELILLCYQSISYEQMKAWGFTYVVALRQRVVPDTKAMKIPHGFTKFIPDRYGRPSLLGVNYRGGQKVIDGGHDGPLATWGPGGAFLVPVSKD